MNLFHLGLRAVQQGEAKNHNLIQFAKPGVRLESPTAAARFVKVRTGEFRLEFWEDKADDKPTETTSADSPIEAKLAVIDYLVDSMADEAPSGRAATRQAAQEVQEEQPRPRRR
jgi:hypothetical protein